LIEQCAKYAQLSAEARKRTSIPPMVLIVTQRRTLEGLLERAKSYAAFMHFAFYKEILADPYGRVLRGVGGSIGAFTRPTE